MGWFSAKRAAQARPADGPDTERPDTERPGAEKPGAEGLSEEEEARHWDDLAIIPAMLPDYAAARSIAAKAANTRRICTCL